MSHISDQASTLPDLLGRAAAQRPESIALMAPGRQGLNVRVDPEAPYPR